MHGSVNAAASKDPSEEHALKNQSPNMDLIKHTEVFMAKLAAPNPACCTKCHKLGTLVRQNYCKLFLL